MESRSLLRWVACGCVIVVAGFAESAPAQDSASANQPIQVALPPDAALPAHQDRLLTIAFDAASAIPANPHLVTRSVMQESVIAACLELDQPRRALGYIERIDNWLRGSTYADLACYCARHASPSSAQHFIDLATQVAKREEDWRRDQIRTKIAQAYVWLGQDKIASQFTADAASSEVGRVEATRAQLAKSGDFDARVNALRDWLESSDFDLLRAAVNACAILFDQFYADQDRRTQLEEMIRIHAEKLPLTVRLDLFLDLAKSAIKREDIGTARLFVRQARGYLAVEGWLAEDKVPYMGKVARMEHLAGLPEDAERDVNAAVALYFTQYESIISVDHARALWPIAEAYQAMGRSPAALAIYARAIEKAQANPNGRPRAMDLVGECLSMARSGVEPNESMWARITAMRESLREPW